MAMHASSRYRYNREYVADDNTRYLDEREPFRYRDEPDNRFHTAKDGDSWWGIAHSYFPSFPRSAGLWWVVAEFQPDNIVDPTIAIKGGTVIVVPSERLVRFEVFSPERAEDH